jgi:hypothetical protein
MEEYAVARFEQNRSAVPSFAGFGDFVLANREQILRSWITTVDRHPKISSSDNLTYGQLLDHLPELCGELAAFLKRPDADSVKREIKRDAKAHGWKRWRQGYKLDELIREICLVRRDLVDSWLPSFAATNASFDIDAQNRARRVVERFFDNVIIEATVQFVEEHQQGGHQATAGLPSRKKARAAAKKELVRLVSHQMREPLAPLLFALEILLLKESLSAQGVEMIRILQRGIKKETRAIEELLRLIDSLG